MSTSLQVFRNHLRRSKDGKVDASGLLTRECYLEWLACRHKLIDSDAEMKKYQRSLSNHVCGVDGRQPFDPEEEQAILLLLRNKQCWPCFPARLKIGSMGFRSKGFHEKNNQSSSSTLASTPPTTPPASTGTPPAPASAVAVAAAAPAPLLSLAGFSEHIRGYSTAFERFGIDVSRSIFAMLRQFFEVHSPQHRTLGRNNEFALSPAYAQRLCGSLSGKHAGWAVTVYSYGEGFDRRIVAQNALSAKWYGDYMGNTDKQAQQPILIVAADWGKLALSLGHAFVQPGVSFSTQLTCHVRGGDSSREEGALQLRLMDFIVLVDPVSFLNVGISRPAASE